MAAELNSAIPPEGTANTLTILTMADETPTISILGSQIGRENFHSASDCHLETGFLLQVTVDGERAMHGATYFARSCPTCGRMLDIRIELMGKQVACQHCGAHFRATAISDHRDKERHVEQLLARADAFLTQPPAGPLETNTPDPFAAETIDSWDR